MHMSDMSHAEELRKRFGEYAHTFLHAGLCLMHACMLPCVSVYVNFFHILADAAYALGPLCCDVLAAAPPPTQVPDGSPAAGVPPRTLRHPHVLHVPRDAPPAAATHGSGPVWVLWPWWVHA